MKVHLGQEIEKLIEQKGYKISTIAEKSGMEDRNFRYKLKNGAFNLDQLAKLSKVLNENLFELVLDKHDISFQAQEPVELYGEITVSLNIVGKVKNVQDNFGKFLEHITIKAKDYGFRIL